MPSRRSLLVAALTALCVAVTLALFDRAYPLVDVGLRLSRDEAVTAARAVAARERLAPPNARAAARFESNDTLSTYVDLDAGGPDSLRALVRAGAAGPAVYAWAVRLFEPGSARETTVRLAPDGRVVGFAQRLAQDDRRPTVSESAGLAAANAALARWGGGGGGAWRLVSASYVTRPQSGRVDRTFTYERPGRRVGAAAVRAQVVVTGDRAAADGSRGAVTAVRVFAQIPEAFLRRYAEMRAANELLSALTVPAMGLFLIAGLAALVKLRPHGLRTRPALVVGGTVGALVLVAGLDAIPGAWFDYDTATSPTTFVAQLVIGAVTGGAAAGLFVTSVVAAAEVLTRRAFPAHYDWWGYWRHRGAPPIARRVLGGYALAAFGFAYVTVFYLATRSLLGWWVPTGSLDDPNQIASPLPWVGALGVSMFAGTWEEAVFRAVPLAMLALWAGRRRHARRWMAAGVVVTALVFGFGHANYPSWPAYSRGAELFLEAALWAVLYLRVGLPTTVVGHVLYDLAWFGLFSLHGTSAAYRVTFGVVLLAFLLPALAVAQGWLARRRALAAGAALAPPPRFADWRPADVAARGRDDAEPAWAAPRAATARWRAAAVAVALVGLAARLLWPRAEPLGPPYSAPRDAVARAADSAMRARGAEPHRYRRLSTTDAASHAQVRRFLDRHLDRASARRALLSLDTTYLATAWWRARYVHTSGTVAERAEEWTVRVLPDGRVLDTRHDVPEAEPGASPTPDAARPLAERALASAGIARGPLREVDLEQTPRPHRLDTRVEYEDTTVHLPAGASARVRVTLAGALATGVRRGVQLPEAFLRTDRERASRRAVVVALAAIVGVALVVGLVVAALRRSELPTAQRAMDRRSALAVGALAALVAGATWANGLPALLASWPTEEPWGTYLAQAALSASFVAGGTWVAVAGLWALTDTLRRRTPVPWWPACARDAALGGAALGLGVTGAQFAIARLAARPWPTPRDTAAAQLVPWFDGALGVAGGALAVPTVAILGLALAAGARDRRTRWGALVVGALCLAVATAAGAERQALAATAVAAGYAVAVALARWFGGGSAAAWVFAALAATGAASLRAGLGGETRVDVVSGVLGAVTAVSLGAVLWRAAARRGG